MTRLTLAVFLTRDGAGRPVVRSSEIATPSCFYSLLFRLYSLPSPLGGRGRRVGSGSRRGAERVRLLLPMRDCRAVCPGVCEPCPGVSLRERAPSAGPNPANRHLAMRSPHIVSAQGSCVSPLGRSPPPHTHTIRLNHSCRGTHGRPFVHLLVMAKGRASSGGGHGGIGLSAAQSDTTGGPTRALPPCLRQASHCGRSWYYCPATTPHTFIRLACWPPLPSVHLPVAPETGAAGRLSRRSSHSSSPGGAPSKKALRAVCHMCQVLQVQKYTCTHHMHRMCMSK